MPFLADHAGVAFSGFVAYILVYTILVLLGLLWPFITKKHTSSIKRMLQLNRGSVVDFFKYFC